MYFIYYIYCNQHNLPLYSQHLALDLTPLSNGQFACEALNAFLGFDLIWEEVDSHVP